MELQNLWRLLQTISFVCILVNVKVSSANPINGGGQRLARRLIIRGFPAIEDLQSDLYEVYMEPYEYDIGPTSAIASFSSQCNNKVIQGDIKFLQLQPPTGSVLIKGNITGLPAGKHGLHIHEFGDISKNCENLGGHFNPYQLPHGDISSPIRHIGDLGNIEAGDEVAEFKLTDPLMSLVGPRSVVGRALVITEEEDDLGKRDNKESIINGSTKKPLACAIISYTN